MTENAAPSASTVRSAQRVVECLEAQGVRWVFGVPGAKVDRSTTS